MRKHQSSSFIQMWSVEPAAMASVRYNHSVSDPLPLVSSGSPFRPVPRYRDTTLRSIPLHIDCAQSQLIALDQGRSEYDPPTGVVQ
jgi:hypothetical protein